jgi:hypothetical protein
MRESSSYGVTLKKVEPTLELKGESYPCVLMIKSSFIE